MIFEEIRFQNLFSYFGERVFDLRGPSPGKNIALISGRNGHGKTSFLTGVRLLFGGVTEELLASVHAGRKLSKKQYLLGASRGEEWQGAFNRRARAEGQTVFGVRILWREEDGRVEVERTWREGTRREGNSCEEELVVRLLGSGEMYEDESAEKFLTERLPADFQRLFFFDGEQIQTIAEANRTIQRAHAENLLRITPYETLKTYISLVVRDWRHEAAEAEQPPDELESLDREVKDLEKSLARNLDRQREISDQISDLERTIRDEERYLEGLRAYSAERDEDRWKRTAKRFQEEIGEIEVWLSLNLPVLAPFVLNSNLVNQAVVELRKLTENEIAGQIELLEDLKQHLPADVFDCPPFPRKPLTDEQRRFLHLRLRDLLSARVPAAREELECLFGFESSRARALLEVLRRFVDTDVERDRIGEKLNQRSELRRKLADVEQRLNDVSRLSEEEREEYQRRRAANNARIETRGECKEALRLAKEDEARARRKLETKKRELLKKEKSFDASDRARRKIACARELEDLFDELKERLRNRRRGDLEEAINLHLRQLLDSNVRIDKIRITEDFGMQYYDDGGELVGMANISAGMKQLVATALVWALRVVSGKTLPIVIDTPLARLDRQHQENMLQRYFPKVAEQVIVLPTNSELNEERYQKLSPHIYREFRLVNRDGDNTSVVEAPMYPEDEAADG